MRKIFIIVLTIFAFTIQTQAQKPFKVNLYNAEHKLNLHINLHDEDIEVPSMEMFGPVFGYLTGDIYRLWIATSAKIESDKKATIRLSNDLGSETQEVELSIKNDSTYIFEQKDGVVIKKVVKKKLVKIPSKLEFIVIKKN